VPPDLLFFQPNLALQLLPSGRIVIGLDPGEISSNCTWEVGGVLGGVIGSMADPDGEGESVLSSVMLSGASDEEVAEEPDINAERREDPARPKAAVR
jgi:hypothetical protein